MSEPTKGWVTITCDSFKDQGPRHRAEQAEATVARLLKQEREAEARQRHEEKAQRAQLMATVVAGLVSGRGDIPADEVDGIAVTASLLVYAIQDRA